MSFPASWWPENGTIFATTIRENAASPREVLSSLQTGAFMTTTPSERF
jgi:hypothetical protein